MILDLFFSVEFISFFFSSFFKL